MFYYFDVVHKQRTGNAIRAVGRMVSMSTSTRLNANRLRNGLKKDLKLSPISEIVQPSSKLVVSE